MNESQGQEKSTQKTNRYWHMQSVVVYNAFGKALEEFGADTADLIVTVFAFFGWTLRNTRRRRTIKCIIFWSISLLDGSLFHLNQRDWLSSGLHCSGIFYKISYKISKKFQNSVKKLIETQKETHRRNKKIVFVLKSISRKIEIAFFNQKCFNFCALLFDILKEWIPYLCTV